MKIVFSTKNVSRASFLDLCRYAYDYGFNGFEIYDAVKERGAHYDSILRRDRMADAKRKLVNRALAVAALRMPAPVESDETTSDLILKYVDMAASAGIENVIVRVEKETSFAALDEKLMLAVQRAEMVDVGILFETVGYLSNTENVIAVINHFASAAVGASWNVRGTVFEANETAEATIKTLGAYIKYVRLGDMKDGKTVLIGEVGLFVDSVLFLHHIVQMLVAHDDGVHDGVFVIGVLVLLQNGNPFAGIHDHSAGSGIQFAGEDPQKGGLAGTVGTDDAVAVAGEELQVNMLEQPLTAKLHTEIADSNHFILLCVGT